MNIKQLEDTAKEIRRQVLIMIANANSGHPGGSLSSAEIFTALYFHKMRHDPKNPAWPDRDRLILSKGHSCPGMYAAMALAGYFPKEELLTFRHINSRLQGHQKIDHSMGFENSGGPLGQGLSQAVGHAIAGKLDKKDYKVYCLVGDGETQEGQIWEAVMAAAHYKLDNLIIIIDHNHLQIDGQVEKVMNIEPIIDKFKAFGYHVIHIDGHKIVEIIKALDEATIVKGKPVAIVAETIKGKGVSFMENQAGWHGKAPNKDELEKALKELA